jgi:hypothetical protein
MLLPSVQCILLVSFLISSQVTKTENSDMVSSSSMDTTGIFSAIRRSNAYVLPTSGVTIIQSLFARSVLYCANQCNAKFAGNTTAVCLGFIFTPFFCNQSTSDRENCQLVTFGATTTVVLSAQTPGFECQRFFSFPSLWNAGLYVKCNCFSEKLKLLNKIVVHALFLQIINIVCMHSFTCTQCRTVTSDT